MSNKLRLFRTECWVHKTASEKPWAHTCEIFWQQRDLPLQRGSAYFSVVDMHKWTECDFLPDHCSALHPWMCFDANIALLYEGAFPLTASEGTVPCMCTSFVHAELPPWLWGCSCRWESSWSNLGCRVGGKACLCWESHGSLVNEIHELQASSVKVFAICFATEVLKKKDTICRNVWPLEPRQFTPTVPAQND